MSEIMMQLHFMSGMPGIILQRPLLCRDRQGAIVISGKMQ